MGEPIRVVPEKIQERGEVGMDKEAGKMEKVFIFLQTVAGVFFFLNG